jgi:hypothetical protein
MADNCLRRDVNGGRIVKKGRSVNPDATEFDEVELRLRQDIEEALEMASECLHDSTLWWRREEQGGPRTIETLIGMIVVAAKQYRQTLETQRIPQVGESEGNGVGPVYGVQLLSAMRAGSMIQAMPSREDLEAIKSRHTRVVAGFEVLTQHWRDQSYEIERLRSMIRDVIYGKWSVTELQEAMGEFES